jgi:hypothetical protein
LALAVTVLVLTGCIREEADPVNDLLVDGKYCEVLDPEIVERILVEDPDDYNDRTRSGSRVGCTLNTPNANFLTLRLNIRDWTEPGEYDRALKSVDNFFVEHAEEAERYNCFSIEERYGTGKGVACPDSPDQVDVSMRFPNRTVSVRLEPQGDDDTITTVEHAIELAINANDNLEAQDNQ